MKRYVSDSYSRQPHLVHRLIASCIALALFLSPLEFPLSKINESATDFSAEPTAAETYKNSQTEKVAQNNSDTPNEVFTYTVGESATVEDLAHTDLISPPALDSVLVPLPTESTTTETELLAIPAAQPRLVSESILNNHRAARAVANGETSSELVSVSLDANGNIVATTDHHGTTETAEYNADGQPIKITEGDGTTIYYRYDNNGRLLGISREVAVAKATGIRGFFTEIATPLFALADAEEDTIALGYDADNLSHAQNGEGTVEYEYDENGLVTVETRFDGSQVEYEYDELGNVVAAIEIPSESQSSLSLQSFLRLSFASEALLSTVREFSIYNDNSQLTNYQIARVVETLESNDGPIPETVNAEFSVPTTTPTIEEVATTTPATETVINPTEPVVDGLQPDYPEPEATPAPEPLIESVTDTVVSFFVNAGTTIAYWFDSALNRTFADTTDPVATTATNTILYDISFTYDAQGNIIQSVTNTGITTTYTYDPQSDTLLATEVQTPRGEIGTHRYTIGENARITAYNGEAYQYNEAGMLLGSTAGTYTYDENGNRLTQIGQTNARYSYSGNRLTSVAEATGRTIEYTYDERGAATVVSDSLAGTTEFVYNAAGAIHSIQRGPNAVTYEYDALGRRTTRTTPEGTLHYHYTSSQLKRVTNEAGTTIREYYYTPTGILTAVQSHDTIYHVVTNYNRSVVGLVDTTTGISYIQEYDAWGKITASNLPITLDIGYIGAFSEPALGYSILGPRVYDPAIGRFLSKDPLPGIQVDQLSQNEYIYAKNDPINQYDPSGHASELATESASPKRSLVETEAAIAALEADLADAKATVTITDPADLEAYQLAVADQTAIESALTELYQIRTDTIHTIAENEREATLSIQTETPPAPETVWGVLLDTSSTATTTISATTTATTTASTTITPLESIITVPVSTTTSELNATTSLENSEITPLTPTTEDSSAEVLPVEIIIPVTEETTQTSSEPLSYGIGKGFVVLASIVLGDHILKAEAKKKKSKAKKAKSNKKSVSSKAKSKQASKVQKLSAQKKQLQKLQQKLANASSKKAKNRISKRELEKISREVNSIAVSVLSARVAQLTQERDTAARVATERARQQTLATAASNLNTNTNTQIKTISVTPAAPAVAPIQGPARPPQSAGIQTPQLTFAQPNVPWWKTATSVVVSLVPIVGEIYDGWTIYAQKDPITGEPLTLIGNAFTIIGLGTIAGSGKVVREIGERSLREIAERTGVHYDLVTEAAEEVIKETDLVAVTKQGKTGFDGLIKKIGERVVVKQSNLDFDKILDNPLALRGAKWEYIESSVPKNWIREPLSKGEGIKFINPNKNGEQILLEKGWENSTDLLHAGPYIKISRNGNVERIPLEGNPSL